MAVTASIKVGCSSSFLTMVVDHILCHPSFTKSRLPSWAFCRGWPQESTFKGSCRIICHPTISRIRKDHLFATLGAANWITLLRAAAIIALAGFLPLTLQSEYRSLNQDMLGWATGIIYLGISMLDLLDGYVARRQGRETELGKQLDIVTDAAGLLVASLLAVTLGRLPIHLSACWSGLLSLCFRRLAAEEADFTRCRFAITSLCADHRRLPDGPGGDSAPADL